VIVPQAHVRFDPLFQTEMYELFHRRALARLGHLVCTPLINIALLAALALALPHGAFIGAAAIALWSLYVDRAAGAIMIPIAFAAALVASAIAPQLGAHGLVLALGAAWAGALLQALSHAVEPIPPPWTGSHAFMPLGAWLKSAPPSRIALLFLLSPTVWVDLLGNAAPISDLKNPGIISVPLAFLAGIVVSLVKPEPAAADGFVAAQDRMHLGPRT
jgi:cation/acetate symporter